MKSKILFISIASLFVTVLIVAVTAPKYGIFDTLQNLQHEKKNTVKAQEATEYQIDSSSSASTGGEKTASSSGVLIAPIEPAKTATSNPCSNAQNSNSSQCNSSIAVPTGLSGNWTLVQQDEFNTLDTSKWNTGHTTAAGVINTPFNESTEDGVFSANNVAINNGVAELSLKKQPNGGYQYTSGMLQSIRSFQSGFIEARVSFPTTSGVVPAFWLQNNFTALHNAPFIDIFSYDSTKSSKPVFTVAWQNEKTASYSADYSQNVNYSQFHTFGLQWRSGMVQTYIDGVAGPSYTSSNVSSAPSFITLSLAALKGANPSDAKMLIDYVRVWQ